MEKEIFKELINEGLSTREMAYRINRSQTSVRYWLNKYELKTIKTKSVGNDVKKCCSCGEIKEKKEFYKKTGNSLQSYCKICLLEFQKNRWIERKKEAIIYKGSKCIECGLSYPNEPYVIFDFHHSDPKSKKYDWRRMKLLGKKKLNEEIDKCELLCSNCHRKRHHQMSK